MFIKILCIIMEVMLIPATALIFTTAMTYGDLRKLGRKKYLKAIDNEVEARQRGEEPDVNRTKLIKMKMDLATLNEIAYYCIGVIGLVAIVNNLVNNILGR